ncbi:MAG: hypothetical protein ACRDTA_04245 [Pseudonocardiaceae bacterium]
MYHQGNQAAQGTDDLRHSDDQAKRQPGIGHSIRPGTGVPDTILAAHLCDGALLLHAWCDAASLHRELVAAFGATQPARSSTPGCTP